MCSPNAIFPSRVIVRAAPLLGLMLALVGCGDGKQAAPHAAAPPPAVNVIKVATANVKMTSSFAGRVEAVNKVDLRARVDGFLEKRTFREGADVKEGDLLFAIEKSQYQAAVDQAKAGIVTAEATLKLADIEVGRQTELISRNVGAQARVDEVTAKQGEARGSLLAQKASLDKAELNLSYTDIKAPISGRIGRANISVGNFVGPNSGVLATIVSQDPIYVTFPVTQREVLAFRNEGAKASPDAFVIYLQLADGTRYAETGKLSFFDVTVSQGTDTVQVRATFPNPNRHLVDGQLVTVVGEVGAGESMLVVPQQALQLDQSGVFVLVVDKDSKVQVRRVEKGQLVGTSIAVPKGLETGDLVITEGIQRVRPGQVVQANEIKPGP
jgi:membrane fusion protein, multidrug efflux system